MSGNSRPSSELVVAGSNSERVWPALATARKPAFVCPGSVATTLAISPTVRPGRSRSCSCPAAAVFGVGVDGPPLDRTLGPTVINATSSSGTVSTAITMTHREQRRAAGVRPEPLPCPLPPAGPTTGISSVVASCHAALGGATVFARGYRRHASARLAPRPPGSRSACRDERPPLSRGSEVVAPPLLPRVETRALPPPRGVRVEALTLASHASRR